MSKQRIADLKAQARAKLEEAGRLAKTAEDAGRDFSDEERSTVKTLVEEARELKSRWEAIEADGDLLAEVSSIGKAALAGDLRLPALDDELKSRSLGDHFVNDEAVKAFLETTKSRLSDGARIGESPIVGFRGLRDLRGAFGAKDIIAGGLDTSAGALVNNDWRGLLDTGTFQRPLTVADLITIGQTTSDTVEYARVTGFTNSAAPVAEARGTAAGTASGDTAGTKPQSSLTLEKVTAPVRTLAHWVPATKRALSDAAQVRTLIDNFLRYGLEEELEDQIVTGDGTGEDFEGILEVSGTQAQAWDTDLLVTTRKARTKVKTVGRSIPTAYVFNPADNERIDLLKDDNGGFYFGGPATNGVNTLWGLPRVESEAVPSGTGLVADWRQAVLWDREQAGISVSDSHADFFVRNLVAILAEMRAAFGIIRPSAFVVIDLTA